MELWGTGRWHGFRSHVVDASTFVHPPKSLSLTISHVVYCKTAIPTVSQANHRGGPLRYSAYPEYSIVEYSRSWRRIEFMNLTHHEILSSKVGF